MTIQDGNQIVWFASDEGLAAFKDSPFLAIDGTFKVVPAGFYQLVVIHAQRGERALRRYARRLFKEHYEQARRQIQMAMSLPLLPEDIMVEGFEVVSVYGLPFGRTNNGCEGFNNSLGEAFQRRVPPMDRFIDVNANRPEVFCRFLRRVRHLVPHQQEEAMEPFLQEDPAEEPPAAQDRDPEEVETQCGICQDATAEIAIYPCRHLTLCGSCGGNLAMRAAGSGGKLCAEYESTGDVQDLRGRNKLSELALWAQNPLPSVRGYG
ncbi:unnamed protein product [Cyprideis torosa]|uniref:Uncharacterized protein n=1 Tax=Cyprideis torosa TaxID=163714 RepID=A0A7R8WCN3_9CRUS|nr:unnamed protein product [Cyprideis torosa]CAG0892225.1 unnamed protein product [Cyprideis torosa]